MFEGDGGLRIGTSSWSAKDWRGVFYPEKTAATDFIRHYSSIYDTVEVDATFYHMPRESTVHRWREVTPEGFVFAAKVPRVITHEKVLEDAQGEMLLFIETMSLLEEKLGPLLLQFPYFNKKAFESQEPFLERLDRFLSSLPGGIRYAVEVRNKNWVGRQLNEICARHGVALAWVDQAWMPAPQQWQKLVDGPSSDFSYFRFLGDHKAIEKITKSWDRQVIDRSERLRQWAPVLREVRGTGVDVFGFFNNHFAGHAPATIETFREIWQE